MIRHKTFYTGDISLNFSYSSGWHWVPTAMFSVILHLPNSFNLSYPCLPSSVPKNQHHANTLHLTQRHTYLAYISTSSPERSLWMACLKVHREQVSLWGPVEMTYDLSLYSNGQQHSVAGHKSAWNVLISSAQHWIAHMSWPSTSLSLA